ncbi:accessory factor UbiK family protein [Candidatus Bandiella euplotis]|uniref:Membrane fusogenic activity protein n=1 Tax=Candidatus Bandiella euplotis TaxID=1664265 RepID=A0ABZ0UKV9_9RICK|nr:accessory factor UbiK family protein [Candidatus Bandiella woodruffii]WPX96307.1 Putative membrane fusogenic activity protein [Candidatus Bandiella woodruffii]
MKKDNKIMDDIAKLAGSTFAGAVNAKNELLEYITKQVETLLKKMKFVTREEFEVVKKLAEDANMRLKNLDKAKNSSSRAAAKKNYN